MLWRFSHSPKQSEIFVKLHSLYSLFFFFFFIFVLDFFRVLNGRSHYLAGASWSGRGAEVVPAWGFIFSTHLFLCLSCDFVCVCEQNLNKTFVSDFYEYFLLSPLSFHPISLSCQLFRFLNFVFGRFLFTPQNFFHFAYVSICFKKKKKKNVKNLKK